MDAKDELGSTSHGSFNSGAVGMMMYLSFPSQGLMMMIVGGVVLGLVGC